MKQVVAAALVLFLLLFLLPVAVLGNGPAQPPTASGDPEPTGTLPVDHTVVSPPPAGTADQDITVRVAMEDGTVEQMALDAYLWRVVAAEMPASFETEALKAQAMAARTYTASKMGQTVSAHPDADVCTDINCCQAYITPEAARSNWGENADAYTEKITQAVAASSGLILTYQGTPIQAVFFSSAAGRTVDAVEVWGGDVPYLSGVDSPEGEEVPNYHSTVEIPLEEFKAALLAEYPDMDLPGDPAGWVSGRTDNSAGGAASLVIGGVRVTGGALRALFNLRSTSFTLAVDQDKAVFSVTGYGHGVGMSQYGANAMAKAGSTWQEIVTWYYSGVEITPYQP